MRRKMMPRKPAAAARPARKPLPFRSACYRYDLNGRIRPQIIFVERVGNCFTPDVAVEMHLFLSLREARAALPKVEAMYAGSGLSVFLGNKTFLSGRGELGSCFRRNRSSILRTPVRFVAHYEERRAGGAFHYTPVDRFAS
jgi:hypothetical protein